MKVKIDGLHENIFYLGMTIYIGLSVLASSWLSDIINIPGIVYIMVLFIIAINYGFTEKKLDIFKIVFLLVFIVGIISYKKSGSLVTMAAVVFAFSAKGKDYHKIINVFYYALLISVCCVVLLNASGFLPTYTYTRLDAGISIQRYRYSYGFLHPNMFSAHILAIVFLFFLKKDGQVNIYNFIVFSIVEVILAKYAVSYTATILLFLLLLYIVCDKLFKIFRSFFKIFKKIFERVLYFSVPIMITIIVIVVMNNSHSNFLYDMSSTVNGRLLYANMGLNKYGISVLGQKITTYGTMYFMKHPSSSQQYFNVDLLYILLLIRDGLASMIIFWGLVMVTLRNSIKANYLPLVVIIALLLIYSLLETALASGAFLFIFSCAFLKIAVSNRKEKRIRFKYKRCH